jgi:hypothetical protein
MTAQSGRDPSVPLEKVTRRMSNHSHLMLLTGWIQAQNVLLHRPGVPERSSATNASSHYKGASGRAKEEIKKSKNQSLWKVSREKLLTTGTECSEQEGFQPKEYFSSRPGVAEGSSATETRPHYKGASAGPKMK